MTLGITVAVLRSCQSERQRSYSKAELQYFHSNNMPGMSVEANITAGLETHLRALGAEPGSAALQSQNLERLVAEVRSVGKSAVSAAGGLSVPPTPEMTLNEA